MANDTQNVKLGACRITYGDKDLGLTKGGVEVDVTTETHPVTVDQYGESIINEYITKRNIKVSCPLAETTLENLIAIMPGSSLINDGSKALGQFIFKTPTNLKGGTVEVKNTFLLKFTANPSINDTFTIDRTVVKFVGINDATSSSDTLLLVNIGNTIANTITNAVMALKSSSTSGSATYKFEPSELTSAIKFIEKSASAGNALSLASSSANAAFYRQLSDTTSILNTGTVGTISTIVDYITITTSDGVPHKIPFTTTASPNSVMIGSDLTATQIALARYINSNGSTLGVETDNLDGLTSYTTLMTIRAKTSGTEGNKIKISANSSNIGIVGTATPLTPINLSGGAVISSSIVSVKNGVGIDLLNEAKTLTLHPINLPNYDASYDVVIYKAATPGSMKFSFKHNEERIYNTEFNGYPANNGILFSVGGVDVNAQ